MQETAPQARVALDDDARLQSLGYRPQLRRALGLFATTSVAFTCMSPMIGILMLFSLGLSTAGPAYLWLTLIPLAGMLLVALVVGELASHYPVAGALYQYGKYTAGPAFGWFVGWFYGIALLVTVASVDTGAVTYAAALGHDLFRWNFSPSSHGTILVVTLGLLVLQTTLNTLGAKVMGRVAQLGVAVAILGTFGLAIVLDVHGFHHGLGFLTTTQGVQQAATNPLSVDFGGSWIAGALVAVLAPAFIFHGFESAGDLSEETRNAGRQVPRAMRLALIWAGIAAFVLTAALLLAIPGGDGAVAQAVQNGGIPFILAQLPTGLQETLLGLIIVAFFACGTAVQGAGSRLTFSYARDGALPGGRSLAAVSERFKTPANALFVGALITVVFVGFEFASPDHDIKIWWFTYPGGTNALVSLATFSLSGIYLALLLTVIGSMIARARGRVPAGRFALGRWAWPVSVAAAAYLGLMLADLVAPTGLGSARAYVNYGWITLMVLAVVAAAGVIVFLAAHRGREIGEHMIDGDGLATAEPVAVPEAAAPQAADDPGPGAS
jgi:amino acid transporter